MNAWARESDCDMPDDWTTENARSRFRSLQVKYQGLVDDVIATGNELTVEDRAKGWETKHDLAEGSFYESSSQWQELFGGRANIEPPFRGDAGTDDILYDENVAEEQIDEVDGDDATPLERLSGPQTVQATPASRASRDQPQRPQAPRSKRPRVSMTPEDMDSASESWQSKRILSNCLREHAAAEAEIEKAKISTARLDYSGSSIFKCTLILI